MMKKTALYTAIGLCLGVAGTGAQAGLVDGTLLTLEPGVQIKIPLIDPVTGEVVLRRNGNPFMVDGPFQGSSFSMGTTRVSLNPGSDGGIIMGVAQKGKKSHGGFPTSHEKAPIDAAWGFFCNTGLHFTTAPITVIDPDVNNDGGFTQTLDLSGWTVAWNGIPAIPLPGVGTITCSLADCAAGGTYALDYATPIPPSSLHGFGGVAYKLELRGIVSAVPVPAAVWLFGSGLLGLVGVARRKKKVV